MNEPINVVTDIALDREVMSIRTWWVSDPRIAGNPLSVYLYFRAQGDGARVTQAEAMSDLGLAQTAFRAAKEKLRRAGFLIEVRDRHPHDSSDPRTGENVGGKKRYQLWFLDPAEGVEVDDADSLIESEDSIERPGKTPDRGGCTKRTPLPRGGVQNVHLAEKSQVTASVQNVHPDNSPVDNSGGGVQNVHPLKEVQVGRLVGSVKNSIQPTDLPDRDARVNPTPDLVPTEPHPPHDVAAVDAELAALDPALTLTYAQIAREVDGRVDLAQVDVVQAVRDTVLRAARRGAVIESPAAYAAGVIVRKPEAWPRGVARPTPFRLNPDTAASSRPDPRVIAQTEREACARGEHDWGPEVWGELARGVCVRPECLVSRRSVDQAFADLETHYDLSEGRI